MVNQSSLQHRCVFSLFSQHHVNPEHAAHHAAADAKDIAYDGNDGKVEIDDDVNGGRLPTKDVSKDAGNF
jgi:hypothetical protein